ncbi:type I restriction modification DNA specificity domain protein [Leptospira kirschneri str. 200801925]|uniref:Type I restriction modification DNA specificity domain protein n=1 Tax=Leptospira kirschneri str. 200802841 TaxID=1193047 RepID=A0A828Y9J7_9LEPT|nr:restriction endonuclease subunit S [Leptospira kirschneri]EKO52637.1 type I restriction modification DNA specificity domain protein [Leptospira kirschneri str. 200802841]EMO74279.1 type I restriction modification DNA specificity domain protein [Leptospira kirschneri str. 200801925]
MSKSFMEKLLDGAPVEWKTLGEVGNFVRGSGIQKSDFTESGTGCIHYGQIHTHYGTWADKTKSFINNEFAARLRKAHTGDLVIATTSEDDDALAKAVAWLGNEEVAVSTDAYIYRHTINPKYMSYFFQTELFQSQKKPYITGTKVRRISGESLAKIQIPIPPLPVQAEIVRILDAFTELSTELSTELTARKKQYNYYRDQLLSFEEGEVEWKTLGEVAERISSGGTPNTGVSEFYDGNIPWLRTQEINFEEIWDTGAKITEEGLKNSSAKWIPENCVIVAMYGATVGKIGINKIPMTTNQACANIELDENVANYRYVFHFLSSQYKYIKSLGSGSQTNINAQIVKKIQIPIPSLAEQKRIVAILDKFDALTSSISEGLPREIEQRKKQYEYYRELLLSFPKLDGTK